MTHRQADTYIDTQMHIHSDTHRHSGTNTHLHTVIHADIFTMYTHLECWVTHSRKTDSDSKCFIPYSRFL